MSKTILVADDSVTIRKVVELTFQDTEIRVETVGSGGDALARMESLRPDLVLADVVMPAPDGYELCRAVKGSERPVPVLLLSGSFEPFDAQRARECGADGHVQKPFESRGLLQRVRLLVNRPADPPPPAASAASDPAPAPVSIEDVIDDLAEPFARERDAAPVPVGRGTTEAMDLLLGDSQPEPASAGAAATSVAEPVRVPVAVAVKTTRTAAAEPLAPAATAQPATGRLAPEDMDALARAVVARLSDQVLREIAWEVVPELAERLVRERLRELERSDSDRVS